MPRKVIGSGPPILRPAKNPPGSSTRGKALAVIVSVDNPDSPQFATVAINDHFPFESGYAIPMGVGPFTEGVGVGGNIQINATSTNAVTQVNYPVTVNIGTAGTSMEGIVSGSVSTSFPGNITASPNAQTITPTSGTAMSGITKYTPLIAGTGTSAEEVIVQAITNSGTSFTAVFTQNHSTSDPIVNTGTVVIYDTQGPHPESVQVTNVTLNTPNHPELGGNFQATFAYTHLTGAQVSNLGTGNTGYFYFYNNPAGVGGSICWVDLDTKQITSFTGFTSTVAPTPYYQTIFTHRHNGNMDPSGYQNPGPINISYPETIGNLPYWENTIVLQGVVDSDGNVIAVDFNAGMLKRISPGYAQNVLMNNALAGLYEPLQNPIEDNVAFLLYPTQWLWVEWQLVCNNAPTASYVAATFIDDTSGPNIIQVRLEAPANSNYPISTVFNTNVTGGGGSQTVTPTKGTAMANIANGATLSFGLGAAQEFLTVSGVTGSSFNITPLFNHSTGDPIVAYGFGHIWCGTGPTSGWTNSNKVLNSLFTYPQDLWSNYASLHWFNIGLQYVGSDEYRIVVQYTPNSCNDTNELVDFSFHSLGYTSTEMVPPLLPGFTSDNLTDFQDIFFKKYEYRTTKGGLNGNPNPGIPPNVTGSVGFNIQQATGSGVTSFNVLMSFDVDAWGHIPKMSSWGGQVVLLASEQGKNQYGSYGFLQPCNIGTVYNTSAYVTAGFNEIWYSSLGVGSEWDLAIAYVDQTGAQSPLTYLGTVVPPNGVGNIGLIINTNLQTPSISASSATVGPSFNDLNSDLSVSVTLGTAPPFTVDYTKLVFFYRKTGSGSQYYTAGETDLVGNGTGVRGMTGATAWSISSPYTFIYTDLANHATYDFGVGFSGMSGYSPYATPGPLQGVVNNEVFVHGKYLDNGNVVPLPTFSSIVPSTSILSVPSDNTVFCAADVPFSTNNQPTDGSLGRVGLYSIAFNYKSDGLADSNAAYAKYALQAEATASHAGQQPPVAATGNYDITINDLNNGQWYGMYATYISNSGKETILEQVFTYGYGNSGFTSGISSSTNQLFYNGNSGGYSSNGVNTLLQIGDQLIVDPNGTNPELVVVKNTWTGGNPIIIVGTFAHNHSPGVPVIAGNGYIGSLEAGLVIIPPGNLPQMPAGITVTATPIGTNPPYNFVYSGGGEGSYHVTFGVEPTLAGLGGDAYSNWGAGFAIFAMVNQTGSPIYNATIDQYTLATIITPGAWTNGTQINATCTGLSVNWNYQLAVCAIDQYGNYSGKVNPPSGPAGVQSSGQGMGVFTALTQSQYNPQDSPNLVADSDMKYAYYSTTHQTHGPPTPGWHKGWSSSKANFEIYYAVYKMKAFVTDTSLHAYWGEEQGDDGANCYAIEPNSDDQQPYQAMGEPMSLVGGTTYCFSCSVDAVGANAGAHGASPPSIALVSHNSGSTLSSSAAQGATSIHVNGQPTGGTWQVNDFITIYDPGNPPSTPNKSEAQKITAISGTGPYTLSIYKPLIYSHASSTNVYLNWNPASPNLAQILAEIATSFGTKGQISLLYTPSSSQIASILIKSNKCNVVSVPLTFSKPMVQEGFYPGAYVSGPPLKG